jgi:hypothetical protein
MQAMLNPVERAVFIAAGGLCPGATVVVWRPRRRGGRSAAGKQTTAVEYDTVHCCVSASWGFCPDRRTPRAERRRRSRRAHLASPGSERSGCATETDVGELR